MLNNGRDKGIRRVRDVTRAEREKRRVAVKKVCVRVCVCVCDEREAKRDIKKKRGRSVRSTAGVGTSTYVYIRTCLCTWLYTYGTYVRTCTRHREPLPQIMQTAANSIQVHRK